MLEESLEIDKIDELIEIRDIPDPSWIFVDDMESLEKALIVISQCKEVAFDAEGVNLGREGELTVITLLGRYIYSIYLNNRSSPWGLAMTNI
jgi:hypothetical protein